MRNRTTVLGASIEATLFSILDTSCFIAIIYEIYSVDAASTTLRNTTRLSGEMRVPSPLIFKCGNIQPWTRQVSLSQVLVVKHAQYLRSSSGIVCIIHTMRNAEVIRRLKRDGWLSRNVRGSHHQCVHPEKSGRVTVKHPSKELPIGTLRDIYRQANWKWEDR